MYRHTHTRFHLKLVVAFFFRVFSFPFGTHAVHTIQNTTVILAHVTVGCLVSGEEVCYDILFEAHHNFLRRQFLTSGSGNR